MATFTAAEAAADPAFFVDCAACGDLGGVAELLADKNTSAALINGQDKDGRCALHYACLNDDSKLLTMLLADKRVNVLQTTPKGDTCLHLAAVYASLEGNNSTAVVEAAE
jgi:ankyrin repeat protein